MINRNSNIIFYSFFAISIFVLAVFLKYIKFENNIEHYIYLSYIILAFLVAFILRLFVREVIILKKEQEINFYKEKTSEKYIIKEESKEKNIDKSNEIVSQFIKGIEVADNIEKFTGNVLKNFANSFDIVQGIFYILDVKQEYYKMANTFAFYSIEENKTFRIGEGITGQVAKNKKILLIDNVPDNYVNVVSGLGEGSPKYLIFIPVILGEKVIAVIELASFTEFPSPTEIIFSKIANNLADLLHNYASFEIN